MKKRDAVLMTVLLCLSLTGCTGPAESGEKPVQQIGADSKNGFYFIHAEQSGEQTLFYGDYEKQQLQPTHEVDSCPVDLKNNSGEILPFAQEDRLLLIFTGQSGTEPARIETRQLDGSEPETLVEFPNGSVVSKPHVFADGKYLYLTVSSQSETEELMRVNLKSGKYKSVLKLDVNCRETVEGAVQGRLLLRQVLRPTLGQYYWLDPETLEQEVIFSWDPRDVHVAFRNGQLCYWDKNDRNSGFRCLNLETGENNQLTQYTVPEKGTISVQDMDEEHLLVWQGGTKGIVLGIHTGTMHEWDLTQTNSQQPIERCGKTQDGRYLVRVGTEPRWALIQAEDYWNGIPDYEYFN